MALLQHHMPCPFRRSAAAAHARPAAGDEVRGGKTDIGECTIEPQAAQLRHRCQDRFAREVFRRPPFAGSGCGWRPHAQPRLRFILECFPITQSGHPAAGRVINAQPSPGWRLFCSLYDHQRPCFYLFANGGKTIENEPFVCVLNRWTGRPRSECQMCALRKCARMRIMRVVIARSSLHYPAWHDQAWRIIAAELQPQTSGISLPSRGVTGDP
jgi:hypothetical protein